MSVDPRNILVNSAIGGSTSQQVIGRLASTEVPQLQAWGAGAKRIYSLMIGTNDNVALSGDYTTSYAHIQSICSTIAATGASVVVFTILPANISGMETFRQGLNSLIRGGGACSYTIADVGNDATIGQAGQWSNTTYYQSDGIHPTVAGQTIIATYLLAAWQSLEIQ